MAEYLAPAVYVEETSFRAKSIEGVGTSTAAFVGLTARGPISSGKKPARPPLLTSFADFERTYGGLENLVINGKSTLNYIAHAARAFFNNGGGRLYVARIEPANAGDATSGALNDGANPPANKTVKLDARNPIGSVMAGPSGANLTVQLVQEELASTKQLALKQPAGTMVRAGDKYYVIGSEPMETSAGNASAFTNLADDGDVTIVSLAVMVSDASGVIYEAGGLGFHALHPRYCGSVLGDNPPNPGDALYNPVVLSIGDKAKGVEVRETIFGAKTQRAVELKGGNSGDGPPQGAEFQSALDGLLAIEDISIVAAPGATSFAAPLPASVNGMLVSHAEARRSYRIAVLDPPPSLLPSGNGAVTEVKSKIDSTYAALYYPWIRTANPVAGSAGEPGELVLPPSGFVTGIYARSDVQRGVHKAPANETVSGALGLEYSVRFGEQELLNPLGINCIRELPNRGIRVWGARTTSSDPEWKYVNVRRYFIYLEASIDRGTQWAVFEPNGERLWANVRTTVENFLYNEWVNGALLGSSAKEAYFVRCDRSTMTQNDLDNGRLVCLVGVAALKPAEFVIFRIGQKTADSRD